MYLYMYLYKTMQDKTRHVFPAEADKVNEIGRLWKYQNIQIGLMEK